MKKYLFRIIAFLILAVLSSCGGGKKVDQVKLLPVKLGKEYQYVDAEGKIIISPQFAEATIFRNGVALVQTSGDKPKWGFIKEDGKFVINATYKSATIFNEDKAWIVNENAAPTCINNKGEILFTLQNAQKVNIYYDGLAAYSIIDSTFEKWGFVDKTGKIKINPQFSKVGGFSNGKCAVANTDGKWGYIDKEGKLVINPQFDDARRFYEGKAVVKSGEKYGLIDESGKYLINAQFSDLIIDGDIFLIKQDEKWGWCDKDGKILINPQFTNAFRFLNNKLTSVESSDKWGYINKEGKIIINPQFDFALSFNGKLALVQSNKKFGFIDIDGKYIVNPQFDEVSKDLMIYMVSGYSAYELIETDFFNVSAITSRLKVENPEGFSFNSTMLEIQTKFKKSNEDFNKYSQEHMMISSEKITNEASLEFYVLGSPWNMSGWDYAFNSNYKPIGFAYKIILSGNGSSKSIELKKAIEANFTGYNKDAANSNEILSVYNNAKQILKIYIQGNSVIVTISPKSTQ
ncbi:MAG: WG repeat-containing protein [Bacteroidota bacterium]